MKRFFLLFALALGFVTVKGQSESEAAYVRVGISHEGNLKVGDQARLQISVVPKEGWHVYSAIPSEEGAYEPAMLDIGINAEGFSLVEGLQEEGSMHSEYDDIMGGMLRYYESNVVFVQVIEVTEADVVAAGSFDYMACNDFKCIPLLSEFNVRATATK